jgi:hypothetical protein
LGTKETQALLHPSRDPEVLTGEIIDEVTFSREYACQTLLVHLTCKLMTLFFLEFSTVNVKMASIQYPNKNGSVWFAEA